MKLMLLLVLLLVVLPVLFLSGGLAANRPPLLDPPGARQRLVTYLTTNVAETAKESPFPELELPLFEVPPAALLKAAERACRQLGWEVSAVEAGELQLKAVVTTTLLRFRDDVAVRAAPHGEGGSALHIRAVSRVGRGDLAANARHIMDLVRQVGAVLTTSDSAPPTAR